jgi:hypothetical protein
MEYNVGHSKTDGVDQLCRREIHGPAHGTTGRAFSALKTKIGIDADFCDEGIQKVRVRRGYARGCFGMRGDSRNHRLKIIIL